MKELITTQLIEEYQKKIESKRGYLRCNITAAERKAILNDIDNIEIFIDSLQSKQSEERQNIVDAEEKAKLIDYSKVTRVEVINHNPSIKREMGRVFSSQDSSNKVFVSLQDEERTLKIFIEKR
jgi:lysyl-tRNA synthetase class II